MKKYFLIGILITFISLNSCKHEFEEVSYWSWYTKSELLINKKDYYYEILQYFIDNNNLSNIARGRWVMNSTIYYHKTDYGKLRIYALRYVPIKDSLVFVRYGIFPYPLAFDSIDHAIRGTNKWKITYLKDNILRVRTNYKGQVHKMELKINR